MKIVVVGAAGLIGHNVAVALRAAGHDVTLTHHHVRVEDGRRLDMGEFDGVARVMDRIAPDVVILATGPTRDAVVAHPERARMHLVALRTAVRALHGTRALVVGFSSDEVFDGTCGPYLEDEPALPATAWGRMQLAAELMISQEIARSLIVRTSRVYGWDAQGGSPLTPMRRKLALMRPIVAAEDQIITPTFAPWLADGVRAAVEAEMTGVVNIAGPMIEEDRFLRAVAAALGLNPSLIQSMPRTDGVHDGRRAHGGLVTSRAQDSLDLAPSPPHEDALRLFAADEPGVIPPSRRMSLR